jgi:hypothetical protein
VYFDTYFGTCVKADDTDDGGDDVGGAVPSSGGGGLSSGAKAGIVSLLHFFLLALCRGKARHVTGMFCAQAFAASRPL